MSLNDVIIVVITHVHCRQDIVIKRKLETSAMWQSRDNHY